MTDHIKRQRSNAECAICKETMKKPVRMLSCGHSFCEECLMNYAEGQHHKRCPCCRKKIELNSRSIKSLSRNFALEDMIDELELTSSSDDGSTKPYVVYDSTSSKWNKSDFLDKIDQEIKKKNYHEALDLLAKLLKHSVGKDQIVPLIRKINCHVETKQFENVRATNSDLLSLLKSINKAEKESLIATLVDDCDSRLQKVVEKLLSSKSCEVALDLICSRFYILKHHSKEKTRLYKLALLSKAMLPFAREMSKRNQKDAFKPYYKVLDEIQLEIYNINDVMIKDKCTQVAWYLSHYGLCCTEIRDLPTSIVLQKQALTIMEFVFGKHAGKSVIVYGHCHSNCGSAYELSRDLEEAKASYEKAIEAYQEFEDWKSDQEKEKKASDVQKYLERVCKKLKQKDD